MHSCELAFPLFFNRTETTRPGRGRDAAAAHGLRFTYTRMVAS